MIALQHTRRCGQQSWCPSISPGLWPGGPGRRPGLMEATRAHHGFTLIETMLALLIMALLTAGVALSFSQPLKASRTADAIELVRSFDVLGRQAAITSNQNVRLVFDLSSNTLVQRDGPDLHELRSHVSLPPGCRIDSLRIDGQLVSAGEAVIDISPHGWSRSYALHLKSPGTDRWLIFAGLGGQMSQVNDESQIPTYRDSARHNAD
jgi:prepilin-type N-terminal cleavage/methylation domain-containing protein